MTNDLISREALMQFPIRRDHYDRENGSEEFISGIETVLEYAESLPAVDAAPVVHGRWEWADDGYCRCTNCTQKAPVTTQYQDEPMTTMTNYCPHCGARMDKEAENAQR